MSMQQKREKRFSFSWTSPVNGVFLAAVFYLSFFQVVQAQVEQQPLFDDGSPGIAKIYTNQANSTKSFGTTDIGKASTVQTDDISRLLQLTFSDLVQKRTVTSSRILVLNSYPSLANQNIRIGPISFETVEKADWNLEEGNTITFWRMDVSGNQAHFELYFSTLERESVRIEYKFQKIGNEWIINEQ